VGRHNGDAPVDMSYSLIMEDSDVDDTLDLSGLSDIDIMVDSMDEGQDALVAMQNETELIDVSALPMLFPLVAHFL